MTRLADIEEMAQAPPDGVRAALRPGDVAGLYAVAPSSLDGWGEGMEPLEAVVLDNPEPGLYWGELPDGSPVEFTERNVAWIGPSMGGVFDWVKRAFKGMAPPVPGAPPPTLPAIPPGPPPTRLPAPVPLPMAPAKPWFLKLFAPPVEPALPALPAKPSIFEWFRPRREISPGLPALRPETPVAPAEARGRTPSIFVPEVPGVVQRFQETVKEMIPAERPGPLIETPEIFKHIQPTPEEDFEAKRTRQLQLWESLFPEPEPGKDVPLTEMFRPFAPEEVKPEAQVETLPPVPNENLKILPLPERNMLMPAAGDVARGLATRYHPIDELWDLLRRVRQDPAFQRAVAKGMAGEGAGARFQFESLGMCDGNPDVFQALSAFFHIPWSDMERLGQAVTETDEEGNEVVRLTNLDQIYADIVFPASEVLYQAFEFIKPQDLPGQFSLEWGSHRGHS